MVRLSEEEINKYKQKSLEQIKRYVELPIIYQLKFLDKWCKNNNCKYTVEEFTLDMLEYDYEVNEMEQFIKLITHNMPYKFLLKFRLRAEQLNEIRRLMEDTIGEREPKTSLDKAYFSIIENIASNNINSSIIYQLRRFIKCKDPLNVREFAELVNFICNDIDDIIEGINSKIPTKALIEQILIELYDIYNNYTFECVNSRLNEKEITKLINNIINDIERISDMYDNINKQIGEKHEKE